MTFVTGDLVEKILKHRGAKYDFLGLLGSHFLNLRIAQSGKWFYSKICAYALGLKSPHSYSPGDLKRIVEEHNETFKKGDYQIINNASPAED